MTDFERAIMQVESGGDLNAIGDKDEEFSAYGPLQIRWPCVLDVNRRFGTNYRARQCLGNLELSIEIFRKYMQIYATEKLVGRPVTQVDRMRLWNGGIGGIIWNPHPNAKVETKLQNYVRKVEKALKELKT